MAIHPDLRSSQAQGLSPQQTRAISAWTEQATASLQSLNLSEPRDEPVTVVDSPSGLRGASVSLAIPLDDDVPPSRVKFSGRENHQPRPSATFRRREPIRRDSLRRREALLKGKDGSRRRQRWENGASVASVRIGELIVRPAPEQPLGRTPFSQRLGHPADLSPP